MLIAEMPELGQIIWRTGRCADGARPIAHDSGAFRGKRAIGGGRRLLRHVMFQAALVASHHNPVLKTFADRLRDAGKPHKVVITAVARKLVTIANALCKSRQSWASPGVENTVASSFLGTVVDQTIGNRKPPLALRYMDVLTEAIKRRTLAGSGIAWLPESAVAEEIARGDLVVAGGPDGTPT